MLYIFTGDGKGKTTAAIGSLVRGYGAGKSCAIVFFDKNPDYCNELEVLKKLGITAHIFGENRMEKGYFRFTNEERDIGAAKKALNKAYELANGQVDILVLDELLNALRLNQIALNEAVKFIDFFPKNKYLILTGRGLPEEIKIRAEMISEVKKIKHPFDNGTSAQKGIDF